MIILRLIIECAAPFHCGSGEDDPALDAPVTRDAFGLWRMPGSSIAGVLRSLAEKLAGASAAERLFGEESRETTPSLIWVSDGVLLDFDGMPAFQAFMEGRRPAIPTGPYLRDHVRLDPETGAAADGGKFDEEIVPPGTRFAFEISYDEWNGKPSPEDEALFLALAALLKDGYGAFGGKHASGYGCFKAVQCECRRFDLAKEDGMNAWLNLSEGPLFNEGEGESVELPKARLPHEPQGISGFITLPLVLDSTLLVGGPAGMGESGAPVSDADMACLTVPVISYEKKKAESRLVLPGTSVKGALAHRVQQIAELSGCAKDEAESLRDALFGKISKSGGGRPGKVIIRDNMFSAPQSMVQHVAIDRFSGGAMPGALFNEEPVWKEGLEVALRLEFEGIGDRPAAFLLHALLDLAEGGMAFGGGVNRGNGRLRLKNIEKGASALAGVQCELYRDGRTLRNDGKQKADQQEAERWLDALENAQHAKESA